MYVIFSILVHSALTQNNGILSRHSLCQCSIKYLHWLLLMDVTPKIAHLICSLPVAVKTRERKKILGSLQVVKLVCFLQTIGQLFQSVTKISDVFLSRTQQQIPFKSTVMRKTAKAFNISGWLFSSLIAKSKVPVHTYYLPH